MYDVHRNWTLPRLLGIGILVLPLAACAGTAAQSHTATTGMTDDVRPTATTHDARPAEFRTWLSPIYGLTPDLMNPDGKTMINGLLPMNPDDQG
jgi:hypothetical protein